MLTARPRKFALPILIVLVSTIGLLGDSGFSYAAERTVLGEVWSQDN